MKIHLSIILLLLATCGYSQDDYSVNILSDDYKEINDGTPLFVQDSITNQNNSIMIEGGFSFNYFDERRYSILVHTNGNIHIGNPDEYLSPLPVFLKPSSLSSISYKVVDGFCSGKALVVQYKNMQYMCDTANLSQVNYQVWIYENLNRIEFRFGVMNIPNIQSNCGIGYRFPPIRMSKSAGFNYVFYYYLGKWCMYKGDVSQANIPYNNKGYDDKKYFENNSLIRFDDIGVTGIQVYPNPFLDNIHISNRNCVNNDLLYSLYNINGIQVQTGITGAVENTIYLGSITNGIYFLKIFDSIGNSIYSTKLVKTPSF